MAMSTKTNHEKKEKEKEKERKKAKRGYSLTGVMIVLLIVLGTVVVVTWLAEHYAIAYSTLVTYAGIGTAVVALITAVLILAEAR